VTVDRDADGAGCQLTWEQWADITDDAAASRVADIAAALLHGLARRTDCQQHSPVLGSRTPAPLPCCPQARASRTDIPPEGVFTMTETDFAYFNHEHVLYLLHPFLPGADRRVRRLVIAVPRAAGRRPAGTRP
jgi:hypothetical protein